MINNEYNIPFEYKIVHGREAIKTCLELSGKKGITPVIMGKFEDIEFHFESPFEKTPEEIIEESKNYNIKEFVENAARCVEDDPKLLGEFEERGDVSSEQSAGIVAHLNIFSKQPLEEIYIGLIPTEKSFEIPAYVSFGGWDWCEKPEDHVAIMRYWNEKYGIEIVSITSNVIECIVKNPPATKEEALELAKEQYWYCPDLVTQGTQTIAALAATLLNNKYWYFWWE